MCTIYYDIYIGILTGLASGLVVSLIVSKHYYILGRKDAAENIRRHQITTIEHVLRSRLTELAPMRTENIQGEDGVNSTSHFFLCQSEILKEYGYMNEAKIVQNIAYEMIEWQKDNPNADTPTGNVIKTEWSTKLKSIVKE